MHVIQPTSSADNDGEGNTYESLQSTSMTSSYDQPYLQTSNSYVLVTDDLVELDQNQNTNNRASK